MNLLESALRRIATDLDRGGRQWALVGGFAVSARAEPRFTRDVDVSHCRSRSTRSWSWTCCSPSSGIEPELVRAAETVEILPDLAVPVARTGHLIAVKLLSRDDDRRPQDLMDLRSLLGVASDDDLSVARQALRLITERGFHRGRDLEAGLVELLS